MVTYRSLVQLAWDFGSLGDAQLGQRIIRAGGRGCTCLRALVFLARQHLAFAFALAHELIILTVRGCGTGGLVLVAYAGHIGPLGAACRHRLIKLALVQGQTHLFVNKSLALRFLSSCSACACFHMPLAQ